MARNSLIAQAYSKVPETKADNTETKQQPCPHCGNPQPVDTVGVKKRMAADVQQGAKQRDDALFYNRQEVASPTGDARAKHRRASDDAQSALNRTAAAWQARSDTLTAARAKKGRK